ncbi:hypothetical protein J437_LFUL012767 [Ladona fulva]|uniref:Uncharacterized protein n=1 Tax=Ladona fulva TaxID=123851 RepID=A0A8K0P8R8_LADFU|nr:hypothetical protein J437_LFUL012767 [Ladona fulva]
MGSLRRMMGNRPLPPPPTQSHLSPARNPMMSRSNQQIDIEMNQPSKFHTMREGVGHSSFHHGSDFMSRWRHPSLSNPPPPPSKPPIINGHRRTSVGDLWEHGSTREASLSHNSNVESGAKTWKSNASDGRASPSPWGQPGFVDNGTATLNRRRRSEMSTGWNGGWQRSGMMASASVTDLNAGMGPWAAPGGIMQQVRER